MLRLNSANLTYSRKACFYFNIGGMEYVLNKTHSTRACSFVFVVTCIYFCGNFKNEDSIRHCFSKRARAV